MKIAPGGGGGGLNCRTQDSSVFAPAAGGERNVLGGKKLRRANTEDLPASFVECAPWMEV